MNNDETLFMRADQVEAAWEVLMPVLDAWRASPQDNLASYPAGSWGPQAADELIARSGGEWFLPLVVSDSTGQSVAQKGGGHRGAAAPLANTSNPTNCGGRFAAFRSSTTVRNRHAESPKG